MSKGMKGIRMFGKKSDDHDDEDKRAQDDEDEEEKQAQDDDEDEEAKKAQDDDEDEEEKQAQDDDDDEDEPASKKAARVARKAARKEARQIAETCTLAGKPELAAKFIAKGTALADVRKTLLKQQASESGAANIAGQTGPNGSPAESEALWAHAVAKNSKAFGLPH